MIYYHTAVRFFELKWFYMLIIYIIYYIHEIILVKVLFITRLNHFMSQIPRNSWTCVTLIFVILQQFAATYSIFCCKMQQLFIWEYKDIVWHDLFSVHAKFHGDRQSLKVISGWSYKRGTFPSKENRWDPIKRGPPGATTHFWLFSKKFYGNLPGNRFPRGY